MFTSLFSLTISLYTPSGVYCVIYPSLQGNIEEFGFSIPLLRMIQWTGRKSPIIIYELDGIDPIENRASIN